mgnify:FL=1|tara:strand:+ start:63 stop:881 length:819 start_codon:yes stop_codon:yes gene_type:complete
MSTNINIQVFFVLFITLITNNLQGKQSLYNKTVVVFSFIDKTKENNNLNKIHKNLTSLGVDVVNYIDLVNTNTSTEVKENLTEYFKNREIKNILLYNEENQEISFFTPNYILNKNTTPYKTIKGDSVLLRLKEDLLKTPTKQKTFLYSPKPEVIKKTKVKPFNKILLKPNLKNQKIGIIKTHEIDSQFDLVKVEKKEDYRFYYSSGINYFITFYVGTESFLNKTYGVVGLEENSNQEMLILVLEHTATRNKLFYFNKKTKTETELLKEFLSN